MEDIETNVEVRLGRKQLALQTNEKSASNLPPKLRPKRAGPEGWGSMLKAGTPNAIINPKRW